MTEMLAVQAWNPHHSHLDRSYPHRLAHSKAGGKRNSGVNDGRCVHLASNPRSGSEAEIDTEESCCRGMGSFSTRIAWESRLAVVGCVYVQVSWPSSLGKTGLISSRTRSGYFLQNLPSWCDCARSGGYRAALQRKACCAHLGLRSEAVADLVRWGYWTEGACWGGDAWSGILVHYPS